MFNNLQGNIELSHHAALYTAVNNTEYW